MNFAKYMDEWLYGENGYYKIFRDIGKEGDFYTAVSSSAFFGATIAEFIYRGIINSDIPRDAVIVEIGAHRGYLIADIIQWLYTRDNSLIDSMKFATVERQEDVKAVQREYFLDRFGSGVELIQYSDISSLNEDYIFFVANEIFDAFACELYKDNKIAKVDNHTIYWEDAPRDIIDFANRHNLKVGEIATGYEEFANSMYQVASRYDFVTFDYGEKYIRNDFSIRIYKEHQTLPLFDEEVVLFELFGVSDITYDVNFAHLIDAYTKSGAKLEAYETQARALIRFGIIDLLQEYANSTTHENYIREADKVKTLIAPTIMGDKFKMVHFKKR